MTDSMERRVEATLRAWGRAAVPTDESPGAGAREKKTVRVLQRALSGVAQRRRRQVAIRRWGLPLASAAAGLGLLLGGALWYRGGARDEQPIASLLSKTPSTYVEARALGEGVVARRNGVAELLRAGAAVRLGSGDGLSTPPDGSAQLGLDEGGVIELAAATELVFPVRAPDVERFDLNVGRVSVDIPPNPARKRTVVVQTPDVAVAVHGTSFVVDVREQSVGRPITAVTVSRGTVWITRGARRMAVLGAGESWSSVSSASTTASKETNSTQNDETVEPTGSGRDGSPSKRRALASSMGKAASAVEVRSGNAEPIPGVADVGDGAPTVSDQLRRENRQFQAALKARNAGDDRTAVAKLETFLRAFPNSVLAQEARVERFRALKRLGRQHDAEQAARQYLADFDDGFARSEARNIALAPDGGAGSSGR